MFRPPISGKMVDGFLVKWLMVFNLALPQKSSTYQSSLSDPSSDLRCIIYVPSMNRQGLEDEFPRKNGAIFRVSVNLPEGTYFPVAMENPSVVPRALILDLCHIHLHIKICRFVSICGTYPKIISFKTTGGLEVPQFETHGPYLAGAMAYHLQPTARAVRQKKT